MRKYKLFIRQYDITSNDYKVREEIVETNDIYHEIGKIYSTSFTEIKRIDYQEIDETKILERKIEQLQDKLETLNTLNQQNLKNKQILQGRLCKVKQYIKENVAVCAFGNKELPHWEFDDNNIQDLLKIIDGIGER